MRRKNKNNYNKQLHVHEKFVIIIFIFLCPARHRTAIRMTWRRCWVSQCFFFFLNFFFSTWNLFHILTVCILLARYLQAWGTCYWNRNVKMTFWLLLAAIQSNLSFFQTLYYTDIFQSLLLVLFNTFEDFYFRILSFFIHHQRLKEWS